MESFRMRFSGLGAGGRRHTIHAVHHARWAASCRKGWRRVARQGHHRSRVPSKQGGLAADGVKAARQTIKRGNSMTYYYHWVWPRADGAVVPLSIRRARCLDVP